MFRVREVYVATAEAVGEARKSAIAHARALGADNGMLQAVALAVSEAVTNAAVHAYHEMADPGEVVLEVEQNGHGGVIVRVSDRGRGLLPRINSPGLGFGLPIISTVADDVRVKAREEHGVELSMHFRPRAAEGS